LFTCLNTARRPGRPRKPYAHRGTLRRPACPAGLLPDPALPHGRPCRGGKPGADIINTFDGKPATLSLGTGELSPAIEQRLLGLAEGTRTTFELPAGEAFGERNPELVQWVARKLLNELGDPDEQYKVGDVVQFPTPDGMGQYAGAVQQVEGRRRRGAVRLQPPAGGPARGV
jgi:FKBP-type peptidyl-prolyl cis-trans isomerase SlpA